MALFFAPNLAKTNILPEEESIHAIKVLRLQSGDEIELVDGYGGYFRARITLAHPRNCTFKIIESILIPNQKNYKLHIAIAPTKNIERLEWFIEKATEIGIDEITPIICCNSERKVIKPERLERVMISAAKQSKKSLFPRINPICSYDNFLKEYHENAKFIAHCYDDSTFSANVLKNINYKKQLLQNALPKANSGLIMIGPEGDFSIDEVEHAFHTGYIPVSLGESRLRTETAGVVACCTAAFINA